jgi:CHAT domain-containing protein/Tfp pilus assembly protein PilF
MSVRDRVAIYLGKISRSRVLQIASVGWIFGVAACTGGAHGDRVTEYSAELDVDGDNQPAVVRTLRPGAYLVEVRELDVDLRMFVDAAGARTEAIDKIPRHGYHAKVVSLHSAGELRVEVRSADHRAKRGRALVRIARWQRAVDAPPGELELGYAAFGDAGEQTAAGTAESWTIAADKLHEAINLFAAASDDSARAQGEYTLGNLEYLGRNEFATAIRAAESAQDAYDAADDEVGVQNAKTLRAAAELELASGMNAGTQRAEQRASYEDSDHRLEQAAAFFDSRSLPVNAEYAINMRGIGALYRGNYEVAGKFFAQAVERSRANRDPGEESTSLANLAWVHRQIGYIQQAATEYEALLPLVERERQPALYAAVLGNYGFCLIALGDFDRALTLHTEALQLYRELNNEPEQARQLAALGGLHFRIGDIDRALETLDSAIVVQKRVGDSVGESASLRVAGNAAAELGQHARALEYLRRAAQIDANQHNVARTRVLISGELRALGDLRGADTELAKALESPNLMVHAGALDERAQLRLAQHDFDAAIGDLRAADGQYAAVGLEYNRIDTNTALSQALLATGDVPGASAAADQALAIVRRIRVKSANPEWRARFLSARYSPFEARIAADFAAGEADPLQSSWRAFRTAEEVRARSLADHLAVVTTQGEKAEDPVGDALLASLTSQQLSLEARMQRQDADDAATIELRRSIEVARARLDAHQIHSSGVAAGDSKLPQSLANLQLALPADTAVLAYFVGDRTTHAWLLTRRELRHVPLAGRVTMQATTDAIVAGQRQRGLGFGADRASSEQLLGKLLDGIREKRLLLIPDGPLNGVPFASLSIPGSASQLLVDRFTMGYAPSLALALRAPKRLPTPPTRIAVVSDPVYAPDDRRFQLASADPGSIFRGQREASPDNLTRLPYSALEAHAVARAYGAKETIQLDGFDANSERVLQLPSNELAVLHFATHALARKDSPEQSALYLSSYSPSGALRNDSQLTAREITRRGLHADLVVLSGCSTGNGSELRGEGVLGLTYGFLANGSHSVVAALWPIEDSSTARFMNEFYRAYRTSGRAADALRIAQLRTRGSAANAVWSSFVVRANEFP